MSEGYKKIFWGIFIATFNISLGMITILPAFVGWIIATNGIFDLDKNNPDCDYSGVETAARVLVAASLGGSLLSLVGGSQVDSFMPLLFFPVFIIAIELVVFHRLLESSIQHLTSTGSKELAAEYTGKDRTYIVLVGITLILLIFSLSVNNETTSLLGALMAVATRIYLMATISSLRKDNYKSKKEDDSNDYQYTSV